MPSKNLNNIMLLLAWQSIAHGLKHGAPISINVDDYPEELRQPAACYIMLKLGQQPRGCVGSVEAIRPLGEDIAENAFAAAFCDRHFAPLSADEFSNTEISILLLSELEALPCQNEEELINALRPNVDGLMLRDGPRRANLLPTAWENIRGTLNFVSQIKQLAGLPMNYWSKSIQLYRYTARVIPDQGDHSFH